MEDCAMVRLNAPEVVAYPCDAVWPVARGRERVNHLEIVFFVFAPCFAGVKHLSVNLIDSGRGWHCYPEFIVAPLQAVCARLSCTGRIKRGERFAIRRIG